MDKLQTINFYDDEILVIRDAEGHGYVVLKRLCENLGIDAKNQREKIQKDPKFVWGLITSHDISGRKQELFCIRWDQIQGWLFSINANRIDPNKKDKLLQYQTECFQVMHEYFMEGGSLNPRIMETDNPQTLIEQTVTRMLDKLKDIKPVVVKTPREIQLEIAERELNLFTYVRDKSDPEYRQWANSCIQVIANNYLALPSNPQIEKNYSFFLSQIFLDLGFDQLKAFRKATVFGKLKEVKALCKGKKRQLVNNNTVAVNYYSLGDYNTLKAIATEWVQKINKNKGKCGQRNIFS